VLEEKYEVIETDWRRRLPENERIRRGHEMYAENNNAVNM